MKQQSYHRRAHRLTALIIVAALYATPLAALAQTRIKAPDNRYSVSDDVRVGREAAAQAERQLPILRDDEVTDYVQRVGRRLVAAIPPEFQHPEFRYTFKVVNARDINAFALPGGPMFVNRGMIEAARTEGEMAGVMAHEISHVALRHGTAQATKAGSAKAQLPAIIGAIGGAILGGAIGGVAAQAGQIGSYAIVTKYSREFETQADVLGAQIMARAGYDPHDLANMFRTIEREGGGSGGPEWLSTHPNPGNRYERINQEAAMLRISGPAPDPSDFNRIQARLRGMPRAPSSAEIARGQGRTEDTRYPRDAGGYGRVANPSSRYRTYSAGTFRISVPDNWRELAGNDSVTYAPEGAYGSSGITHGVLVGTERSASTNLRQATDQYLNQLARGNPDLRQQSDYRQGSISGRRALGATLSNINPITGRREIVTVYTTFLNNGDLFYLISVVPENEYNDYQGVFQNILRSIQLAG